MSRYDEDVEIYYDSILKETDFAFCVRCDALLVDKRPWIPKSVIQSIDKDEKSMVVPYWYAKEKRFI